MTTTTALLGSAALAAGRRARAAADAAEVEALLAGLEWARCHQVISVDDAANWGGPERLLCGDGVPMIDEYCVAEFATALGMGAESGRAYLAHALELGYRLPKVFARVTAGELPVWRARKIAEKTLFLSPEAAAFVDQHIAKFAHKIGLAATERLVDTAIARFMPDLAAEIAEKAADGRGVSIDHRLSSFTGTSTLFAELDLADALDLDDAIIRGAAALKAGGSDDSLGARRAAALGLLARGQDSLDLDSGRDVILYAHLEPGSPVATLENAGGQLLAIEQLQTWCLGANVTIRPVIDLNQPMTSAGYQPSPTLREQVILRDKTCVFPHCTRKARSADLDHIEAYDPTGPPTQTTTTNLAALCRHHHRLKTHGGWSYTATSPGEFLWRSPHGHTYLRDPHGGTQDLTPRPLDPPGS